VSGEKGEGSRVCTFGNFWYGTKALDAKKSGLCRRLLISIFLFPPNAAELLLILLKILQEHC